MVWGMGFGPEVRIWEGSADRVRATVAVSSSTSRRATPNPTPKQTQPARQPNPPTCKRHIDFSSSRTALLGTYTPYNPYNPCTFHFLFHSPNITPIFYRFMLNL